MYTPVPFGTVQFFASGQRVNEVSCSAVPGSGGAASLWQPASIPISPTIIVLRITLLSPMERRDEATSGP